MNKILFPVFLFIGIFASAQTSILIEAESFVNKGGWLVDPQFVEQMGSPYLLAHGMGIPVENASTTIELKNSGLYYIWARTKNWVPGNWEAPGRFLISVDGQRLENELGKNEGWNWEFAGKINLKKGENEITLHDLTGFEGRCDAIYLSTSKEQQFPVNSEDLKLWRKKS